MKRLLLLLLVALLSLPSAAEAAPGKGKKKAKITRKRRVVRERPVAVYTKGGLPNIQAQAAVVVDLEGGSELFQKNPDAVRPIASISKLMAMMVVLERNLVLDATTVILESDRLLARRGARSRLPVGMAFTNRDLLHAALMASDNRAVPALGRAVGLTVEGMTAAMNKKAALLGMTHTSFGDPTGLSPQNLSTPREVAKMLGAALKVALISEITRKPQYVASPVGKPGWRIEYANTDVIARGSRFSVLGGKTGYTDRAGYCLAIAARLAGKREVAMVFLGAHGKLTRFADFHRTAQWIAEKKPATAEQASASKPL
ncbi:MAG: peptidase S11 [Myxococcales bacterium]|nr:peptidase S11 [Myxococcales bacterium]